MRGGRCCTAAHPCHAFARHAHTITHIANRNKAKRRRLLRPRRSTVPGPDGLPPKVWANVVPYAAEVLFQAGRWLGGGLLAIASHSQACALCITKEWRGGRCGRARSSCHTPAWHGDCRHQGHTTGRSFALWWPRSVSSVVPPFHQKVCVCVGHILPLQHV